LWYNHKMITIRTRFAPSPTGNLHIGGARSALFAYLWAKKNHGQFILRVEDTDRAREKVGALENQMEGLKWLGINWDEGPKKGGEYGPYVQSERFDIYQKYAAQLLAEDKVYRCFCTPERLAQMRQKQQENKQAPRYDRVCRHLSDDEIEKKIQTNTPYVLRLKVPEQGTVEVYDAIRGAITFNCQDIDDQVLVKSDGFPTYHLANVVDDHLMKITHVIRGEEWLPSTPKHVLLYQALGFSAPQFVHLSIFLAKAGGKMSKRHGETSLLAFRDKGYLSEAIVNFIALLGWNPKTEQEYFTKEELIEQFEISKLNTANPVFETEKLDWMNQHYLKKLSSGEMFTKMKEMISLNSDVALYKLFAEWFSGLSVKHQESIWHNLKERSKTLEEVAVNTMNYVNKEIVYQPQELIWKKSDQKTTIKILENLIEKIKEFAKEDFLVANLEPQILAWIKTTEWGNGDVLWPMRFALSGEKKSPSPFELAEILGPAETINRLTKAKESLNA